MTTTDIHPTIEALLEEFRSSQRQKAGWHIPGMPIIHLCLVAGVIVFSLNLVR
jgi:hypothetical protein